MFIEQYIGASEMLVTTMDGREVVMIDVTYLTSSLRFPRQQKQRPGYLD